MVKVRDRNLNGKTVKKQTAKEMAPAYAASVVPPRNHAGSRERVEMFMHDQPWATCRSERIWPGRIQDHSAASNS